MFSKFMKFFEVKEDATLDYMDPDKLLRKKKRVLKDPLNQEEEDEFFRQLEVEESAFERPNINEEPRRKPRQKIPRESVLKKMSQCMKERDWNPKHHPKIIIGGVCLFIGVVILAIALHETPNPLIGKWRPQGKNIFLPVGDIEFAKDKVQALNITTMVKYDIDDTKINVIDTTTNTGVTFYITSDKTIETNLLGVKTTYKKVEK
ncbi:hypothetical protein [Sulfurospirillum diekertiae]|uniref:Uncharacterized protein n=1 Tax=Sulfurospirillum diekertiae TaxID=1854492 RepID=A0A1Y0HM40_9BACT|nr:hypothetical protein [Sulfurospirillum diekertiae]ARU48405.1 hypothetical protein Sdiek1_1239 [Sulfurospirillum diekertiae]ASC93239.1 hypothetical protein Sdiek2_1218 [Sulfurospirillum diekertiae]